MNTAIPCAEFLLAHQAMERRRLARLGRTMEIKGGNGE